MAERQSFNEKREMQVDERLTWRETHELNVSDKIKLEIQNKEEKLIKACKYLQICCTKTDIKDAKFQHWFIRDKDYKFMIEFSKEDTGHLVTVKKCSKRLFEVHFECEFKKDANVEARINEVLGATNHSFLLRNSEHIARYIYNGVWVSFQVLDEGSELRNMFQMTEAAKELMYRLPLELDKGNQIKEIYTRIDGKKGKKAIMDFGCHFRNEEREAVYNVLVVGEVGAGKRTVVCHLFNRLISDTKEQARTIVEIFTGRYVFGMQSEDEEPTPVRIFSTIGTDKDTLKTEKQLTDVVASVLRNPPDKILIVFSSNSRPDRNHPMKPLLFNTLNYKEDRDKFLFIMTKCTDDEKEMETMFANRVKEMTNGEEVEEHQKMLLGLDLEIRTQEIPSDDWNEKTFGDQLKNLKMKVFSSSSDLFYSRPMSRASVSSVGNS